jgi:transcriptional adapter 2-alpha
LENKDGESNTKLIAENKRLQRENESMKKALTLAMSNSNNNPSNNHRKSSNPSSNYNTNSSSYYNTNPSTISSTNPYSNRSANPNTNPASSSYKKYNPNDDSNDNYNTNGNTSNNSNNDYSNNDNDRNRNYMNSDTGSYIDDNRENDRDREKNSKRDSRIKDREKYDYTGDSFEQAISNKSAIKTNRNDKRSDDIDIDRGDSDSRNKDKFALSFHASPGQILGNYKPPPDVKVRGSGTVKEKNSGRSTPGNIGKRKKKKPTLQSSNSEGLSSSLTDTQGQDRSPSLPVSSHAQSKLGCR